MDRLYVRGVEWTAREAGGGLENGGSVGPWHCGTLAQSACPAQAQAVPRDSHCHWRTGGQSETALSGGHGGQRV